MKIYHTCMCGTQIELSSTQNHEQLRCPDCGMSVALEEQAFSAESTDEATTATASSDLFPDAETASIDRAELLALSKSTSKVCSGIRAFRVGVLYLILCAFLLGLGSVFAAYHVNPTITRIVTFASYAVAIVTAFYALLGWYYWSKVVPSGLKVRRSLLTPLLATSKFGFWILFFVPVAAGFLSTETWMRDSEAAIISAEVDSDDEQPARKIDPVKLEKKVEQITDVPGHLKGGILGKVGMAFLLPAIVLPALLTLSIVQIKKFLASWRNERFSVMFSIASIVVTFVFTLFALIPIVGFLISVVAGLYWNRQLTSIGNESLLLLTKLSKATQTQPESIESYL